MDSTLRNDDDDADDDETCPLYPNTRRRPLHAADVVVEHAVAVAHRAVARVTADRIMTHCEAHPRTNARKDFCCVDTKPTVRNSRKYPLPPLSFVGAAKKVHSWKRTIATPDADGRTGYREYTEPKERSRIVVVVVSFFARRSHAFLPCSTGGNDDDDDGELRTPGGACRWCEPNDDDARTTIVGTTT